MSLFSLAKPLIHSLPPEAAHALAISTLKTGVVPPCQIPQSAALKHTICGIDFPNPVGLAAGFDKNAEVPLAMIKQGFGFVEVGTCTPKPQPGNPKPRMLRVPSHEAVINRLGFNNGGAEAYVKNLIAAKQKQPAAIIGANIGKNKTGEDTIADYVTMVKAVGEHCDYITVNISSPNTEGLRDLQAKESLEALINGVMAARSTLKKQPPIFLKIAPDITDEQMQDIVEVALAKSLDALIVSNTTITRPDDLPEKAKNEAGGLSGVPLFERSTNLLRELYRASDGQIPLIGVGGVNSADTAYAKIRAGASLVQLYTALVYHGLGLIKEIVTGLDERLKADGFTHISQAIGVDA